MEGRSNKMMDEAKSKAELIAEINALRHRVKALEAEKPGFEQSEAGFPEYNLLRILIDNLPDYFYVKDTKSRFLLNNKASLKALNARTQADLFGKTDFDIFSPGFARQFYQDEQELMQSGQPIINKEELTRDQQGNLQWLLTTKVPLKDGQENITGLVGMSRDITKLKQAQEAVAISRDTLQRLIQQLPIGVEIFDTEGFTVGLNDALLGIFGITDPEKVIGRFNLFSDEMAARTGTQAAGRRALAGEVVHLPEVHFNLNQSDPRFADKAWGHVALAVTFFPVRNAAEEVVQIVALNEDTTQRKLANEALRESEERYRRLVELFPEGIFLHVERQIKFVNPAGAKILGASNATEILDKHIFEFVHPDYHTLVETRMEDISRHGQRVPLSEQKIVRLDGTIRDIEVTSIPTTYRGQPAIQSVFRDITERKQTELELARFRAIMDQAGEAIFVIDTGTSNFIDVNQTACRSLGYSRRELIGHNSWNILASASDTPEAWIAKIKAQSRLAASPLIQDIYQRKDGTTYPVEVSYRTFAGNDYILVVARDITEKKQLEEQLRQGQKLEAVGQLASGIAHNFNNMLTAIMGYTGLSLDSLPADHPVRNDLQGIQKTAQRAAKLTQQLLAFTRSQVIQPKIVNLNDLIDNMNTMLRQLISEAIDLVVLLSPELDPIQIDPGQFEQVLVNLVVNARDAMPLGGKLIIETQNVVLDQIRTDSPSSVVSGEYVMMAVTDNGCGMTEETRAHIFEPFFTTKEVGQGTGLGLATCFGIVKQHKGHITVESEPDHGAIFKVYFPRIEGPLDRNVLPDPVQTSRQGTEIILLVEDEIMVRTMAARVLRQQGYLVLEADNGQQALELVREHPAKHVELLVTDMVLPGLGGNILAERLKAIYPWLKIVFISGYTDNEIVIEGKLKPDINFLAKPFTPDDLIRTVRRILDQNRI